MHAAKTVMPFGRFGGLPVAQLRTDYLLWLLAVPKLGESLRRAVEGELARRRALPAGVARGRRRDGGRVGVSVAGTD